MEREGLQSIASDYKPGAIEHGDYCLNMAHVNLAVLINIEIAFSLTELGLPSYYCRLSRRCWLIEGTSRPHRVLLYF